MLNSKESDDRESKNDFRITKKEEEPNEITEKIPREVFVSALQNCNIPENFKIVRKYLKSHRFSSNLMEYLQNIVSLLNPEISPDPETRDRVFKLIHTIIEDNDVYYVLIYQFNFHEIIYQFFPEPGCLVLLADLLYLDPIENDDNTNFLKVFTFLMNNDFVTRFIEVLSNYTEDNINLLIDIIRALGRYRTSEINLNTEFQKYILIGDKLLEFLGNCSDENIFGKFITCLARIQVSVQKITLKYIEDDQLFEFLLSFPENSPLIGKSFEFFRICLHSLRNYHFNDEKFERLLQYCFNFITDDSPVLGDACYFFAQAIQYSKSDDEKYINYFFSAGWFNRVFTLANNSYSFSVKKDLTDVVLAFIDSTRNPELMQQMIDSGIIGFIEMCIESMPDQMECFLDAIYRILEVADNSDEESWKYEIFENETISDIIYNYNPKNEDEEDAITAIMSFDPYK